MAISHALTVLGYCELTDDLRPSEDIWLDDAALNEHFEAVKARNGSPTESVPDLDENELTRGLR